MIKIIWVIFILNITNAGEPLVDMAKGELVKAKDYLTAETIRYEHLPLYAKLIKARYFLTLNTSFLTYKNSEAMALRAIIKITKQK